MILMGRKSGVVGVACAMAVGMGAAPAAGLQDLCEVGRWDPSPGWSTLPAHHHAIDAIHLTDGTILFWSAGPLPHGHSAHLWDPADDSITDVPTELNLHCTGHVGLTDGTVFMAGGGGNGNGVGIKETSVFTLGARPSPWQRLKDMNYPRWYPTCTTMPDGRVLVVGGNEQPGVPADIPEIYDRATDMWDLLPGAQTPPGQAALPLYPFMFVLPDGKLFFAGPREDTYTLDVDPQATQPWTFVGTSNFRGDSAVMYEPGRVLKSGGIAPRGFEENLTDSIDLNLRAPQWTAELPMQEPRRDHNLVLLPDGTILAVGGSKLDKSDQDIGVLDAEWFNPAMPGLGWERLAPMSPPGRWHHSTAILLADATVLAAGVVANAYGAIPSAEIFSPPYLFSGNDPAPRPEITFAPSTAQYGDTFSVALSQSSPVTAQQIGQVTLVRLASVTHSFDQNQRFVRLQFSVDDTFQLSVTAPANSNLAPPGYYMLFVVSDAANGGVPSVARYVGLGTVSLCPWDCADGDGNVGIVDFLGLLAQWGGPGTCDVDGGGVGITDFLALLANWGPCP